MGVAIGTTGTRNSSCVAPQWWRKSSSWWVPPSPSLQPHCASAVSPPPFLAPRHALHRVNHTDTDTDISVDGSVCSNTGWLCKPVSSCDCTLRRFTTFLWTTRVRFLSPTPPPSSILCSLSRPHTNTRTQGHTHTHTEGDRHTPLSLSLSLSLSDCFPFDPFCLP